MRWVTRSAERAGQLLEVLLSAPEPGSRGQLVVRPLAFILHRPQLACKAVYVPLAVRTPGHPPGNVWTSSTLLGVWADLPSAQREAENHATEVRT